MVFKRFFAHILLDKISINNINILDDIKPTIISIINEYIDKFKSDINIEGHVILEDDIDFIIQDSDVTWLTNLDTWYQKNFKNTLEMTGKRIQRIYLEFYGDFKSEASDDKIIPISFERFQISGFRE